MQTYKHDYTEPISSRDIQPIFDLLASYRSQLAQHPFLVAAQHHELSTEILLELAFHQYSDSILWIPMLAQMKQGAVRSRRLQIAIEDNIAHEAGIGRDGSTSHVTLAVQMIRSLGVRALDAFPTATFGRSATLWLSDEFVGQREPEIAGWLLVAETLVPQLFAAVAPCYERIAGCETRYFTEHVAVDSDEHARWMADAVIDVLAIYGSASREVVIAGMVDAWQETCEVPDELWRRACASR
ncbi:MAG: iron-containing redox enzyme family protein [Deltaproteobacteria bacterium]|nr:iron-containing redox enzyme family protein [Deltaproteobacteria bacterium]MDQ3295984.1 iron-containing redox enzyme family protein [Myxococcota bacterium]